MENKKIVDSSSPLGNTELVTIRRHPFGLLLLYLQTLLGYGLSIGLIYLFLPDLFRPENRSSGISWVSLIAVVFGILLIIFLGIASALYDLNRWLITFDNITQTLQKGLFNKYTSELSLINIEDVSAERRGFFASILNFGTLNVETAGQQDNFTFIYCPKPEEYAKIILNARNKCLSSPHKNPNK